MSLMGALYVGTSGLQAGQNALNTTAHNMSNVSTTGYSRQLVHQSTRQYVTISVSGSAVAKQQVGLGVVYAEARTVRDYFLDQAYRKQVGRSSFYENTVQTLEEVENLFQELEGEDFATALENLWSSVQDLANDPDLEANQGIFVQRSHEFLTRAQAVYDGLSDYQDNINESILGDVDTINEIGRQIHELNRSIVGVEAGTEHANDLRDMRNQLLDELGSMASITFKEDKIGNITVEIEGKDFVTAGSYNTVSVYEDPVTGFYTPYWKQLAEKKMVGGVEQIDISGAELFDLSLPVSSDMETDIGGLKSKILSRGFDRATYKDLDNPAYYNNRIAPSVIMNVQAEFDRLVHLVTTGINDVLTDAANAAGAYPGSTYLRDENGDPYQMFNKVSPTGDFTVNNLVINDTLRQAPTLLGFMKKDEGADFDIGAELKKIFDEKIHVLNPNVETAVNLAGFYNAMISQVGGTAEVAYEIQVNQELTVDQVFSAREQIVGVATDEELSNMVMYQNAYNASSRYINVISEMLEHIINTLGT